jgi:hypothetical protein
MKLALKNCCGLLLAAHMLMAKEEASNTLQGAGTGTLMLVASAAFLAAFVALKAVDQFLEADISFDPPKPSDDVFIDQLLAGNGSNFRVSR